MGSGVFGVILQVEEQLLWFTSFSFVLFVVFDHGVPLKEGPCIVFRS
jgi:hypothetical protein